MECSICLPLSMWLQVSESSRLYPARNRLRWRSHSGKPFFSWFLLKLSLQIMERNSPTRLWRLWSTNSVSIIDSHQATILRLWEEMNGWTKKWKGYSRRKSQMILRTGLALYLMSSSHTTRMSALAPKALLSRCCLEGNQMHFILIRHSREIRLLLFHRKNSRSIG